MNRSRCRIGRPGALTAVALLGAATVTGCAGGGSGAGGFDSDAVTVAEQEPDHLIPGWGNGYNDDESNALFAPLVAVGPDNQPVLNQAASIKSSDNRVWTIKIKPGWTFSNGEPVTAQSYLDGWNTAAYSPNAWQFNYMFANVKGYKALNPATGKPTAKTLSGAVATDDHTIRLTLTKPDSQLILEMAGGYAWNPLPKVALKDLKAYDEAPIGDGPFMMDGRWEHNRQIKMKRSPTYAGTPAKVTAVTFKMYSSTETAYTDLQAGNVDVNGVWSFIPPEKLSQVKQNFQGRVLVTPQVYPHWLAFPLWDNRFADAKVREAISVSIDRKTIVDKIFGGLFEPAEGLLGKANAGGATGSCGDKCAYDPGRAKQLLAAAGGWSGPLNLYYIGGQGLDSYVQAIANNIRQNLGIQNVVLKAIPTPAQYAANVADKKVDGPFIYQWSSSTPSPQDLLAGVFQKSGSGSARAGYYSNASVDSGIAAAQAAASGSAATDSYHRAEAQIMADFPVAPIYQATQVTAYSPRIKKVSINLSGLDLTALELEK